MWRAFKNSSVIQWSKNHPELAVTWVALTYTFGIAGYMLGQRTLSVEPQSQVRLPEGHSHPWEVSNSEVQKKKPFKYKYYPHGDTTKNPGYAPPAIRYTTVPVSGVPQEMLDKFSQDLDEA
ncbi:fungal protein [Schizosaccharomyces japonicus yFS275]|uniref:Fungal protein n=1 Tax=Schizosaccharomyces japonicus (strain yFS275 / FY16936) TaxID=402676 RepID=B6K6V0_SCHJY|nr:fungal protein [Schizosaccharomyces japonicus yFS275]EEB09254.2 fungal protein [Schizosaccharomyces japonicus yFS275]